MKLPDSRRLVALLMNIPLGMVVGAASLVAWGISDEWKKDGIRIGPTADGLAILAALGGLAGAIIGTWAAVAIGFGKLPLSWRPYLLCALCTAALVGGNIAIFSAITFALLGK